VATTVYQNGTIATPNQGWNLIAPIAAVAEAAMQQDYGRAGPVSSVPDPSTVAFDVPLIICDRQQRGAVRFKPAEVVVVRFHLVQSLKPLSESSHGLLNLFSGERSLCQLEFRKTNRYSDVVVFAFIGASHA